MCVYIYLFLLFLIVGVIINHCTTDLYKPTRSYTGSGKSHIFEEIPYFRRDSGILGLQNHLHRIPELENQPMMSISTRNGCEQTHGHIATTARVTSLC